MATSDKRPAKKAVAKTPRKRAESARPKASDDAAKDAAQAETNSDDVPAQQEVDVSQRSTQPGDHGVNQTVNTQGETTQTSQHSGGTPETATTTSPDSTPSPEDDPEDAEAQPPVVTGRSDRHKKALGRVSLVTLEQAVTHMQPATGIDKLQKALGLPETGYPDDSLTAAIAAYRKDHDLGDGTHLDAAFLQSLGFEVITI